VHTFFKFNYPAQATFPVLSLAFFCLTFFACSSEAIDVEEGLVDYEKVDFRSLPPESGEMVKRYQKIFNQAIPDRYYFLNTSRSEQYAEQEAKVQGEQRFQFLFNYANELLFAGKTVAARNQLASLLDMMQFEEETVVQANAPIHELIGLSYVYEALQKQQQRDYPSSANFFLLQENNALEPKVTEALQPAAKTFRRLLTAFPEDAYYGWMNRLLEAWLGQGFRPDPFAEGYFSPHSLRFRELAGSMGLPHKGMLGGVCVEDFNRDGVYDIISGAIGLNDPLFYYEGDPSGGFRHRSKEALLEGSIGGISIIQGDYNNDGYPDVYVVRGGTLASGGKQPNSLLKNNGDGTFTDVTVQAGLLDFHPGNHAHFVDYDKDGQLDIFVANESLTSHFSNADPCKLFHNNGDGTFTEVSTEVGLDISKMVKGSAWLDVNNDGWLDVYVSIAGDSNRLYLNKGLGSGNGTWAFEEVPGAGGAGEPVNSGYCLATDFDQDGREDLLVFQTNPNHFEASFLNPFLKAEDPSLAPVLFLNQGNGQFKSSPNSWTPSYPILALSGASGDLSNNGYPDVYVGSGNASLQTLVPNSLLLNSGHSLAPDMPSSGTAYLGKTQAVQLADFNQDGKLDILASMGGFYEVERLRPAVMLNESSSSHSWMKVRLEGKQANRQGVGSRIVVTTRNADGSEQVWYHRVGTGHSPAEVHIGLGGATEITELAIHWADRTGKIQRVRNPPLNQGLTVKQE
jgi:hypothetical protein